MGSLYTEVTSTINIYVARGKLKGSYPLNYTSKQAELGITHCFHLNELKNLSFTSIVLNCTGGPSTKYTALPGHHFSLISTVYEAQKSLVPKKSKYQWLVSCLSRLKLRPLQMWRKWNKENLFLKQDINWLRILE